MAYVRIDVAGIRGSVQLRAYAGSEVVATSPSLTNEKGVFEVATPQITRATIPLNFRTLAAVCHLSMDADCQDERWGTPIKALPLLRDIGEGLNRLETDLRNRYAPDRRSAIPRYRAELGELIRWLDLLQDPTSLSFANPGALPDRLRLPSPDADSPLQSIQPQAMLLLAALDPNIARFLSLYWVDQYGASNGPEPRSSYDYKVVGRWRGRRVGCGLVFGLGVEEADLPSVDAPLEGNQLPGLRWQDKDPLGRVGLRWPRPQAGQGAVQPVLFDLWRDPGTRPEEFLTAKLPVLVPATARTNDGTALFVDTNVPLGQHSYRLQAIDLFGQVGEAIESRPIPVQDLEAPPPPVRLRASLAQPGYPWRTPAQRNHASGLATLDLQFEYRDANITRHRMPKRFASIGGQRACSKADQWTSRAD
jgi:hypothetical protein